MDTINNDQLINSHQGISAEDLRDSINHHLKYSQARDWRTATVHDLYYSIALTVRDRLVQRWIKTQHNYFKEDPKTINYLSMEYLVGRALSNYLVNLDFKEECCQAIRDLGIHLEEIEEEDIEAGLGNGGLGRLAACFLDSMATLGIPGYGYGIRYEFGIFHQRIVQGAQVETADNWLRKGNPWEIPRPDYLYPIKFYGTTRRHTNREGLTVTEWVETHDDVLAMAYDIPIPGFHNQTVNNLRLWSARSTRDFDLGSFNQGDYIQAVRRKQESETISRVLYPNDKNMWGKELRLKQEYFFVSASLQDIIRRYKRSHTTFDQFSSKVAIQLNDTHPALAIPELMRILVDEEHRPWDEAWKISIKTFGYTNHTVLPEAMEKWPVSLMHRVLPRHLEIVYEINHRFLTKLQSQVGMDSESIERLSLIEEKPEKSVRMANLALVGSHTVNGVSKLHTELLETRVLKDFYNLHPERFQNKTNGVTQRLWLKSCNPGLAGLISRTIGDEWIVNLSSLRKLLPMAEDAAFRDHWMRVKRNNKIRLAQHILDAQGVRLDPESLFDVQIKRIHEYKRQLMCAFHAIYLYNRYKADPDACHVPRTLLFAGKAAPGYDMAKRIIQLIGGIANRLNQDPQTRDRLKVVFIPNYSVDKAENIIPAADLSEQISTAGMEASGTGNMKLSLNGALTIGTLDGANIEIREQVGSDNIFIFGMDAEAIHNTRCNGYNPREIYESNADLRLVIEMVRDGYFSPEHPHLFHPIVDSLLNGGDPYMVLADFADYCRAQKEVEDLYSNREDWARKSIINSANMGMFSSDRVIKEYSRDIWNVEPCGDRSRFDAL